MAVGGVENKQRGDGLQIMGGNREPEGSPSEVRALECPRKQYECVFGSGARNFDAPPS